jgi:hypothetical protein
MSTSQQQLSKLQKRMATERSIATAVVKALLAAGFAIEVDNGGDEPEVAKTTDKKAILKGLFLCDDERLYVYNNERAIGWVYFVYGNDGWDVINDYTVNLQQWLGEGSEVQKLSDRAEERSR